MWAEGKKRNPDIELWRFIGILIIVIFHLYHIGVAGAYHWYTGWYFTDLFFLITGYYTTQHFYKREKEEDKGGLTNKAIKYTLKKAKRFFPYTAPSIIIAYVLELIPKILREDFQGVISSILNFPLEACLLTSAFRVSFTDGIPDLPVNAPLWFLSALLIVLPFFCWTIGNCSNGVVFIAAIFAAVIDLGFNKGRQFPNDILRCFLGLYAGTAIYYFVNVIYEENKNRRESRIRCWGGIVHYFLL